MTTFKLKIQLNNNKSAVPRPGSFGTVVFIYIDPVDPVLSWTKDNPKIPIITLNKLNYSCHSFQDIYLKGVAVDKRSAETYNTSV